MNDKKLKIGFYGHSICSNNAPGTYLREITNYFDAKIINKGTGRGSEERILFELKKSTDVDVAIVCHSHPRLMFIPNFPQDIDTGDFTSTTLQIIKNKFPGIGGGDNADAWTESEKQERDIDSLPLCIELYQKHLYHADLQMNRYLGALMMIDDYCLNKVPITIHLPVTRVLPPWFKFKSGKVLVDLSEVIDRRIKMNSLPNGLSPDDNQVMKDTLIKVIKEELNKHPNYMGRSREDHAPDSKPGDGGSNPPPMPYN